MNRLWLRGRLVTPERVIDDGLLEIEGERIVAVWDLIGGAPDATSGGSPGAVPPAFPYRHLLPREAGQEGPVALPNGETAHYRHETGGWLVPGFVDVHVHGGFGGDFSAGDPAGADQACAGHLRHGTTALLATTVTLSPDATLRALEAVRASRFWAGDWKRTGRLGSPAGARLVGFHVEGPFINPARKGAQDPAQMRPPDPAEFERWHALCPACAWVLTLAPELPGALPLIAAAASRGVTISLGHTDATYAQVEAAVAAGARSVTHLFNAMSPLHHREPGAAGAALTLPLTVEMIADGLHVHLPLLGMVARLKGPDRAVLITDAIQATGMPDGAYNLGRLPIVVEAGVACLADGGSLAGSTLTMDRAVANMVHHAGVELPLAVRMASLNPARLIGLDHLLGSLAPGKLADVLLLGPDLKVQRVYQAGRLVHVAG